MLKTLKEWNESKLNLSEYLQSGDQVDDAMAEYFLEVVPPATYNLTMIQVGEPCSHIGGRATYATLHREGGV